MRISSGNPKAEGDDHFTSREELAQLAAQWPMARVVRIWNTLPGSTPLKRFTDRNTALNRIWKALQTGPSQPNRKSESSRKRVARSSEQAVRAGTKKAKSARMVCSGAISNRAHPQNMESAILRNTSRCRRVGVARPLAKIEKCYLPSLEKASRTLPGIPKTP
jgi:hypothetical protein